MRQQQQGVPFSVMPQVAKRLKLALVALDQ